MFSDILDKLASEAENSNPQKPEDYRGEDGLLYCGQCGTAKQKQITIGDNQRVVFCACKCIEVERRKQQEREKAQRIERRRNNAFVGFKHRAETFETDKEKGSKISKLSRNYAKKFDPDGSKWLIFYGDCGTGKSYYAAAICNAVIDRGYTAKVTSVSAIIRELWNTRDKCEYYEWLDSFDLLVLDDFDAERSTEYANEIRYEVIEMRSNSCKPLIVTTNRTAQELGNAQDIADKRTYSRLFEHGLFIAFKGKDKRKESLRLTMQAELDKLLCDD